MNFIERKVSVKSVISFLVKEGVEVDDSEAAIILDFLYLMAKNHSNSEDVENVHNPKERSNSLKSTATNL